MQFLVYLMVLLGAISTVLLEVHWLTSPAPQPKPTVQAGAPPRPKVEGPNAALSPIYPKKLDAPRPVESNSQAQTAPASTPQTTGAPAQQPAPAAPPAQTVPPQQPATAQTTQAAPAQQPAATPQSQPKNSAETTGAAVREDNTRQVAANPANASNRNDNPQQTAQGSSRNRCDILACAGTYRSFRANDCTYQPFDGGPRRLCEKSPGQRMAREQPDRRRWGGDAQARYLDRPASGRRFVDEDDDVAADFDYARREPAGFFIFGRRPRW
jgi:BA14K-like protein